ncbi:MAG: SPOR domain-containing protein [Polaribacter sp.]|nr:SPOR domain-containing protein [Polaribacter sp.]
MNNKNYLTSLALLLLISTHSICAQNNTNSSNQIKNLISKKRTFNSKFGYGFRVQIFYGEETKAKSVQNKFKANFPSIYTKLDYDQPYWKVQVGNYKTRLEADKAMVSFSEKFSGIIVIPLGK